jgi:protein TonB
MALEGPAGEFKVAAVEGLRRWRFRPGIKDGRAVRTHMQIPLVFSLQQ